jgi:acyl-homoserine lactone acylase PvdQ
MEQMQMDVVSTQAARFMAILRPLLPATPHGEILRAWDERYDLASRGAPLFERVYRALLIDVFGRVCGSEAMRFLSSETGIVTDFYHHFDRVLLQTESVWFGSKSRDTSFAPSYRLVTDLGDTTARTSLAGGPSDRRFSRWYTSGVEDWLAGRFKTLRVSGRAPTVAET